MSEKRFHQFGLWVIDDPNLKINTVADLFDTKIMSIEEVVDLLNEQQATIQSLKEENEQLKKQLEIRTESDKYHQRMLMKWLCKDDGDGV